MSLVPVLSCISGAVVASVLACVPGLHVYNIIGLFLLSGSISASPDVMVPLMTGMIVGYAVMSTLPSVYLAAPEESALFIVMPGQKYLMCGRGHEGVMLTACGSLAGLFMLLFLVAPLGSMLLPVARIVFQPHSHWILWCVICFMLITFAYRRTMKIPIFLAVFSVYLISRFLFFSKLRQLTASSGNLRATKKPRRGVLEVIRRLGGGGI